MHEEGIAKLSESPSQLKENNEQARSYAGGVRHASVADVSSNERLVSSA